LFYRASDGLATVGHIANGTFVNAFTETFNKIWSFIIGTGTYLPVSSKVNQVLVKSLQTFGSSVQDSLLRRMYKYSTKGAIATTTTADGLGRYSVEFSVIRGNYVFHVRPAVEPRPRQASRYNFKNYLVGS
jgi:hypothetical protein